MRIRRWQFATGLAGFDGSQELARVAEVFARVEAGQPWLVAIEGDPGMGKTALARRCLAQAPGLKVLSARGDQAEADLDFAYNLSVNAIVRTIKVALPGMLEWRRGCIINMSSVASSVKGVPNRFAYGVTKAAGEVGGRRLCRTRHPL